MQRDTADPLTFDWQGVLKEARSTSLANLDGQAMPRGSLSSAMPWGTSTNGRLIDEATDAGVLVESEGEFAGAYSLSSEYKAWLSEHSPGDRADTVDDLRDRLGLDAPDHAGDADTADTDTDADDDSAGEEVTAADLLVDDGGDRTPLPDRRDLLDCVEAAVDYFHSELSDTHRDLIRGKWGVSNKTIDDLNIGFAPSDDSLLEHLFGEGFMPLTIINAGLTTPSLIRHVYAAGSDCPDDCWHDYPDAFETVAERRDAGDIEFEEIDLGAVVAHAGRLDCLCLDVDTDIWWDNRIVWPYWHDGDARYLIARATGQSEDRVYGDGNVAKYLKQATDKPWVDNRAVSEPIYGLDTVEADEPLIITEGMTDAIMAHQAGFNCISPVTKQFKSEHHRPLLLQAQRASEVYLCLDNEASAEGLKGALKTGTFLAENGVDAKVATLPRTDASKVDLADYLKAHTASDLEGVLDAAVDPSDVRCTADDWPGEYAVVHDGQPAQLVGASESTCRATPAPDTDVADRAEFYLASDDTQEAPGVAVRYAPPEETEPVALTLEQVADRHDLWRATTPQTEIRVLAFDTSSRDDYDPESAPSSSSDTGEGSALFDLDIRDVTGMDHLERGTNPIQHRGDSENYFVIIQEGNDYLAYDHKAEAGYYALTFLLAESAESDRTVDAPQGRLTDTDIFHAWRHAKREGYIPAGDPAPYRALLHVVCDQDLMPEDMVPSADDYADGDQLPATVYNRAVEAIQAEYGVSPGRAKTSGGDHVPTEADLGLDEEPASEQDELEQFVKTAKLQERRASNSS